MKFKKTKKHTKRKGEHTIPEIRKTLESISSNMNNYDNSLTLDQRVKKFMKEWKKGVGKNIPYKLAREYVELRMRSHKRHTRRKHMRGGQAPLDYQLRPGVSWLLSKGVCFEFGFGLLNLNTMQYYEAAIAPANKRNSESNFDMSFGSSTVFFGFNFKI